MATRALPTLPPVRVLDDQVIGGQEWQRNSDPEIRATNLWSETHEGMDLIRAAMKNLDAGKDVLDGLDTPKLADIYLDEKMYALEQHYTKTARDLTTGEPAYSNTDLRNDIAAAALTLRHMMQDAQPTSGMLYRGMRVDWPSTVFPVGTEFDANLSSATPDAGIAERYGTLSGNPGRAVMMRIRPGVTALNIDNGRMIGSTAHSEEHLMQGRLRVVSYELAGNIAVVEVERAD